MKNAVFLDETPCGSCKTPYFGGTYRLPNQSGKISKLGTSAVSSSKLADSFLSVEGGDIFTETSVLTGATWHNIPEDCIFHSHRREKHKSYIALTNLGSVAET
jgi:hypothetical protein